MLIYYGIMKHYIYLLDGDINFKEKYINDQNLEMEIWEAEQKNGNKIYAANFLHDIVAYICNGEIEYSEFIKIMKFLIID